MAPLHLIKLAKIKYKLGNNFANHEKVWLVYRLQCISISHFHLINMAVWILVYVNIFITDMINCWNGEFIWNLIFILLKYWKGNGKTFLNCEQYISDVNLTDETIRARQQHRELIEAHNRTKVNYTLFEYNGGKCWDKVMVHRNHRPVQVRLVFNT
jgi:hypothetical protein